MQKRTRFSLPTRTSKSSKSLLIKIDSYCAASACSSSSLLVQVREIICPRMIVIVWLRELSFQNCDQQGLGAKVIKRRWELAAAAAVLATRTWPSESNNSMWVLPTSQRPIVDQATARKDRDWWPGPARQPIPDEPVRRRPQPNREHGLPSGRNLLLLPEHFLWRHGRLWSPELPSWVVPLSLRWPHQETGGQLRQQLVLSGVPRKGQERLRELVSGFKDK